MLPAFVPALLVASLLPTCFGHVALWNPGMYCFNGTDPTTVNYNNGDPHWPLRQMDNLSYQQWFGHGWQHLCKVTNVTTKTAKVAPGQIVKNCANDPSTCVIGPKQSHYWMQKEKCNNFETVKPPTYNQRYGWKNGAQNDIFSYDGAPAISGTVGKPTTGKRDTLPDTDTYAADTYAADAVAAAAARHHHAPRARKIGHKNRF